MRSPFAVFRTNQKTMMVVLVGLSMIGFVLLGAVDDPSNMPKGLVFIAVLAVVGGAAWIAGMSSGRSAEFGSWGLVLGAVLAVVLTVLSDAPPLAVLANSGDLSVDDLQNLRNRREIANRFVGESIRQTRDPRDFRELGMKYTFSFMQRSMDEDIVTGELLRREADRLGLQVPGPAVTEFIRRLTDDKISATIFKEIRTNLKVSEPELYDILADELQAQMAAKFLYGLDSDDPQRYVRPQSPEQYWEFYERMYVKQRLEVAAVPVQEFIDPAAEPTPEEVADLFQRYRDNTPFDRDRAGLPFQTAEKPAEEGSPGFLQPRRVHVGYLEAVFDDFKSGIAAVTDEDIEQYYQEQYVKPAAEAAARAAEASRNRPPASGPQLPDTIEFDLPELPTPPPGDDPPASDAPSDDPPPAEPAPDSKPDETTPPESDAGDGAAPTDSDATPEATEATTEQPGLFSVADGDPSAADSTPAAEPTNTAETPADAAPPDATPAAEQPAEPPAAEPAAESTDATDTPAAETSDSPAETPPETASPASGDGSTPAAPQPDVPLLDEALRTQIRTAIEEQRTVERMRKAVEQASAAIEEKVGYFTSVPKTEPDHMTPEQAAEVLRQYAAEHSLHYAETPFLSDEEMFESEDHPVGAARDVNDPNGRPLPAVFFQTGPQDTYRPVVVANPSTQSWFVAWKIDEQKPYTPANPNEEPVHGQIVKAWREMQAREQAKARAEELAAKAAASGQSLSTSLSETTITGKEGDLFLTVTETPEFSWLSTPGAMGPNPFAVDLPRIQDPPGVERVYEDFMRIVFDELQPGEVGVAPNSDRTIYYVVRVVSRTPTPDDAGYAAFRERFLREPVFQAHPLFAMQGIEWPSIYQSMAIQQSLKSEPNWTHGPKGLFNRHDVQMVDLQPQQPQS